MLRATGICRWILAVWPVLLCAQSEAAHVHHEAASQAVVPEASLAAPKIPDVILTNQHGEKVRFYSDLVRGHTVAVNTIFTTCTTICPLMGANFAGLRRTLDEKPGSNVSLISISIDPVTDSPERLDEWSRRFGKTGPGWTLLTGPKQDIDRLLKALQVFTADKNEHAPVVLIGNGSGAEWVRASALMNPARLATLINSTRF